MSKSNFTNLEAVESTSSYATDLAHPFIDNFAKQWVQSELFDRKLETIDAGIIGVLIEEQDVIEIKQANYGVDLMTKAPTIKVIVRDSEFSLTWNEAYNFADMLLDAVGEAYYG